MGSIHPAAQWAQNTQFSYSDIDCVVAVALKILDGKCKMGQWEKDSLMAIYDVLRFRPGDIFDDHTHLIIESARDAADAGTLQAIHEMRLEAEAAIPKPVMKAFKAKLRGGLEGLQPLAASAG